MLFGRFDRTKLYLLATFGSGVLKRNMKMKKTILITGASSGIGKTTAKFFHNNGWNVIATMRSPEHETELTELENVHVIKLDVTDEVSITSAVATGIKTFGKIDVLLNNAGYGAYGPLEAFPMDKIERQFNTNVIGLLAVTKAVLPHFRSNKSGVIINISSIGGQMTFPLGTLYHGPKFAVGVKVKIVQPGMIKTDFGGRSFDFSNDERMSEYQPTVQALFAAWGGAGENASEPEVVSNVIWQAATDGTDTLRYQAGDDALALIAKRKLEDDATFIGDMKVQMGL
jgi:NADP-dependent 3-hydroxy acid dehydrogenase YdfG